MDALQIVAEPRRREILALIWNDEMAAGDIADQFDVSFAAVSQHLGVLRNAGFVKVRPNGRQRLYRADREALGPLRQVLESMWDDTLARLATAVEDSEDT
ncbi:MAG: metalloregulator ArsR/SmtB family transcription factor [Acidimicrobiia bacterium]|nr:metalloregulator ArsR/SmtB family transcription factor [Acidimicrobiia bacterium]MDH4308534.1 metalloregulator ArsR/SmtB family transcription factor [Acidimicrobiia bacterium]MDH5292362.1 metalloregulator ArsR/SmtB family transcription factor [Acidimicrobiia bacterium]